MEGLRKGYFFYQKWHKWHKRVRVGALGGASPYKILLELKYERLISKGSVQFQEQIKLNSVRIQNKSKMSFFTATIAEVIYKHFSDL